MPGLGRRDCEWLGGVTICPLSLKHFMCQLFWLLHAPKLRKSPVSDSAEAVIRCLKTPSPGSRFGAPIDPAIVEPRNSPSRFRCPATYFLVAFFSFAIAFTAFATE